MGTVRAVGSSGYRVRSGIRFRLDLARLDAAQPEEALIRVENVCRKTVSLSVKASEWERLSILGSYYMFTNQREKSVEAFAALLRLQPDDLWARDKLVYVSHAAEQPGLIMSYADLRPNDYSLTFEAARAVFAQDPVKARHYLDRVRALTTPETGKLFPDEESEVQLFPVFESWIQDDPQGGL